MTFSSCFQPASTKLPSRKTSTIMQRPFVLVTPSPEKADGLDDDCQSPSIVLEDTQRWEQFLERFGIPYQLEQENNAECGETPTSYPHVRLGGERFTTLAATLERWKEIKPSNNNKSFSSFFSHANTPRKKLLDSSSSEEDTTSVTSSCFSSFGMFDASEQSRSFQRRSTASTLPELPLCLEEEGSEHQEEEELQDQSLNDQELQASSSDTLENSLRVSSSEDTLRVSSQDTLRMSSEDSQGWEDGTSTSSENTEDTDEELAFLTERSGATAFWEDESDDHKEAIDDKPKQQVVHKVVVPTTRNSILSDASESCRWDESERGDVESPPSKPLPMPPLIPVYRSNSPTHFLGRRYNLLDSVHSGLSGASSSWNSLSTEGSMGNDDLLLSSMHMHRRISQPGNSRGSGEASSGGRRASQSGSSDTSTTLSIGRQGGGDSFSTWSTSFNDSLEMSVNCSTLFKPSEDSCSTLDLNAPNHQPKHRSSSLPTNFKSLEESYNINASNHARRNSTPDNGQGSSQSLRYPLPSDVMNGILHVKQHRLLENNKRSGGFRSRFKEREEHPIDMSDSSHSKKKDWVPSVPARRNSGSANSDDGSTEDTDEFALDLSANSRGSEDESLGASCPHLGMPNTNGMPDVKELTTSSLLQHKKLLVDGKLKFGEMSLPNLSFAAYDQPPSVPCRKTSEFSEVTPQRPQWKKWHSMDLSPSMPRRNVSLDVSLDSDYQPLASGKKLSALPPSSPDVSPTIPKRSQSAHLLMTAAKTPEKNGLFAPDLTADTTKPKDHTFTPCMSSAEEDFTTSKMVDTPKLKDLKFTPCKSTDVDVSPTMPDLTPCTSTEQGASSPMMADTPQIKNHKFAPCKSTEVDISPSMPDRSNSANSLERVLDIDPVIDHRRRRRRSSRQSSSDKRPLARRPSDTIPSAPLRADSNCSEDESQEGINHKVFRIKRLNSRRPNRRLPPRNSRRRRGTHRASDGLPNLVSYTKSTNDLTSTSDISNVTDLSNITESTPSSSSSHDMALPKYEEATAVLKKGEAPPPLLPNTSWKPCEGHASPVDLKPSVRKDLLASTSWKRCQSRAAPVDLKPNVHKEELPSTSWKRSPVALKKIASPVTLKKRSSSTIGTKNDKKKGVPVAPTSLDRSEEIAMSTDGSNGSNSSNSTVKSNNLTLTQAASKHASFAQAAVSAKFASSVEACPDFRRRNSLPPRAPMRAVSGHGRRRLSNDGPLPSLTRRRKWWRQWKWWSPKEGKAAIRRDGDVVG